MASMVAPSSLHSVTHFPPLMSSGVPRSWMRPTTRSDTQLALGSHARNASSVSTVGSAAEGLGGGGRDSTAESALPPVSLGGGSAGCSLQRSDEWRNAASPSAASFRRAVHSSCSGAWSTAVSPHSHVEPTADGGGQHPQQLIVARHDALGAALVVAPIVQPQAHVAASACQEYAIRSRVHKPGVTGHELLRLSEGLRVTAALHRRAMRRAEREEEEGDCAGQLGHAHDQERDG
jgi:hypothetical protein